MTKNHIYSVTIKWTGNTGTGTADYRGYSRQHEISVDVRKLTIPGSSDPAFRGDATRWNPEELLVASASACHQLWYLHLCADAGIVVVAYIDHAEGVLEELANGLGRFSSITLRPEVSIKPGCDVAKASALHDAAHVKCFIANSLNLPVLCEPKILIA